MKKLYICCDKKERSKYVDKAKKIFAGALKLGTLNDSDIAYIIGEETPEVQKKIEKLQARKVKMIRVNENFINKDLYKKNNVQKKRRVEREFER